MNALPKMRHLLLRWLVVVAVALAGVGLLVWVNYPPPPSEAPPPEPLISAEVDPPPFDSPYLNTKPGVKFTGDAACVACHKAIGEHYRQHPMGRSLAPVAAAPLAPHVGPAFAALGLTFATEARGAQLVHTQQARDPSGRVVAETAATVEYVIGSGTHAYSYLHRRDGTLTQSPVTWFRQKNAFDLSPGFVTNPELFERPIAAGCLFCHTNHAEHQTGTMNRYRGNVFTGHAIGCERCHGPGELHAANPKADRTIVNPASLPPKLRDDVCNQCHLGAKERVVRRGKETFDYRPGLPLDEFIRVFALPASDAGRLRVAGHAEQMAASRCFVKSEGQMGCVSCHDPHRSPAAVEKEAYFRQRCLTCHESKGCTEAQSVRAAKRDNCAACHMPAADTNISHIALTDHRIPRRPDASPPPAELDPISAAKRLVPFGQATLPARHPEMMRDLAVGLVSRARGQSEAVRIEIARLWLPTLERAVKDHPDDLPVRECLGVALAWSGQLEAAVKACEATLKLAPQQELPLADAGLLAGRLGQHETALGYWKRALDINPHSSRYRFEVANALVGTGNWPAAVAECRTVLAANGGHIPSRLLLMQYHWENKAPAQAKAELVAILALHPPNEALLRQRFADILK